VLDHSCYDKDYARRPRIVGLWVAAHCAFSAAKEKSHTRSMYVIIILKMYKDISNDFPVAK
jgi:hypothetical protein